MVNVSLENEQTSLFFKIQKNDEEYSMSDIVKMLRYVAECLENGSVVNDSKFLYMKSFKKQNKNKG